MDNYDIEIGMYNFHIFLFILIFQSMLMFYQILHFSHTILGCRRHGHCHLFTLHFIGHAIS